MTRDHAAAHQPLLGAFRRAAAEMPWYRTLLNEHGVNPAEIVDVPAFTRWCPLLSKRNTFDRFTLQQLAATEHIAGLAGVLTSSGHGGRFSFGLSTRREADASADFIDRALDAAFQIASRTTLAINCLPMGVGFASRRMTVATTSVREDMAVALIHAFGPQYDQILIVADPLFMKKLVDYAAGHSLDWRRFRVHVVLGEEIFGERFRSWVSRAIGHDPARPQNGYVMSSFGAGELGLHLCYETPATIAIRRAACADPAFARDLLGVAGQGSTVPMVFTFEPRRTFIETVDRDAHGYGRLAVSMLDPEAPIPLLRYQTGDLARLLDPAEVRAAAARHRIDLPFELPANLLALQGRDKERLPNGSHVGAYKDALYADHTLAAHLTGAFRLVFNGTCCTMHVQLKASTIGADAIERLLLEVMPEAIRPERLLAWPYHRFPFGMTVDYERKFQHYVPGEVGPRDTADSAFS
jgi:phenylacetate-CoA ligase